MCKNCNYEEYIEEIDELLSDENLEYAEGTLTGIQEWVEKNNHITDNQKSAIENIASSRG